MNEAVQIRRYNAALRAKHPRFRPSLLPPPLTRRPILKISNRESLRLEIDVTQTKQTTRHHSNRETEAYFSSQVGARNRLRDCGTIDSARGNIAQPTRRPNVNISNREKEALFHDPINLPTSSRQNAISSTRKPPGELEKHKIAPPIFVAIKNHPDPLFCWSYV